LAKKVIRKLEFEVGQIDHLFEVYADLLERARENTPDVVEITAMASILHSFYNGLENIFLAVAKGIDKDVPSGGQWHRDLLEQMTRATPIRNPVLTDETSVQLDEYMGFRHFYRHSYSFFLNWERLELLVTPLPEIWEQAKDEIQQFLRQIEGENETG